MFIVKIGSARINIENISSYYPVDNQDNYSGIEIVFFDGSITRLKASELNNNDMLKIIDGGVSKVTGRVF